MLELRTIDGETYRISWDYDPDMGAPWKEHDGHGIVSDWTARDKRPGERVLCRDRGSRRYYDVAETMRIARREGWGVSDPAGKTAGQVAAEAVELDFAYLRRWCEGDWWWVQVLVEHVRTGVAESLGGVESDSLEDVIAELVAGCRVGVDRERERLRAELARIRSVLLPALRSVRAPDMEPAVRDLVHEVARRLWRERAPLHESLRP